MKQECFNFDSGKNVFFTSDTHFGHDNIIGFCNRPFKNVQEMDEELIRRWNEKVGPDDYVFHLGDFCFKGSQYWDRIIKRLNGHIFLILGNHDMKNLKDGVMYKFAWVGQQAYITIAGRSVYLNHFPFLCYGGSYRNLASVVYALHGHTHFSPRNEQGKDINRLEWCFPSQYDVGVDANDFAPISFDEIDIKIQEQIAKNQNQFQSCYNAKDKEKV